MIGIIERKHSFAAVSVAARCHTIESRHSYLSALSPSRSLLHLFLVATLVSQTTWGHHTVGRMIMSSHYIIYHISYITILFYFLESYCFLSLPIPSSISHWAPVETHCVFATAGCSKEKPLTCTGADCSGTSSDSKGVTDWRVSQTTNTITQYWLRPMKQQRRASARVRKADIISAKRQEWDWNRRGVTMTTEYSSLPGKWSES